MDDKPFVINNQFSVDPLLGWVRQDNSELENRLEPRLVRLLCLLVASRNKLVTREFLTKEVWDDYGNADEGLTQAISYLRKLFNDDAKELIETVPKKGYVFHGVISHTLTESDAVKAIKGKKKQRILIVLFLVIILLSTGYYLIRSHQNVTHVSSPDEIHSGLLPDSTKNKSEDEKIKNQATRNPDKLPDTNKKAINSDDLKK